MKKFINLLLLIAIKSCKEKSITSLYVKENMRTKLFLFIFPLFLIIYSCHDGDTNIFNGPNILITQFPQTESLKGEKVDLEILGVNDLYVVDTFLIAFKASGYNDFFEIYSTTDLRYLGKCLSKGRGPNEFLFIQYDHEIFKRNNNVVLCISDIILRKRVQLNLSQSIKRDSTICDTIFRLPDSKYYFDLNDSLSALFNMIAGNIDYKIQNNNTKQIISEQTLLKSFVPKTMPQSILNMGIAKHPTKNIFIGIMPFFNQINIFSSELKKAFSISYGPPCNIFKNINQPDSEITMYYSSFVPTSRYIYTLYINKKVDQFYHGEGPVEIHIFTWDGEAVSKIMIPDNIIYFAVDEKNQYIYGLKGNEEIIRYHFNTQSL